MKVLKKIHVWVMPALMVSMLAACGGSNSGTEVQINPPPPVEDGDGGITYNGPAAATDDVQNFKLNLWDNLATEDRCGSCHAEAEEGLSFVRIDDINLAYVDANLYVDLTAPSLSLMVTQVETGHGCWEDSPSACASIITNYIEAWATASGAEATEIVLEAPDEFEVGASKSYPADAVEFERLVYTPLLQPYCSNCHSESSAAQQQPFFASSDIDVAYQAAKRKINLDDAANSRLVLRLGREFHQCWDNCPNNAEAMRLAIEAYSATILPTEVNEDLVISRALGLPGGIVASSGGRVESNVIALYEFKSGAGPLAYDTSGVDPSLHLNIIGNVEWIGSWGIRINDGKAQGSTSASSKLHSRLTRTGEYSIEAWVVPDNVAQDGPARIVTYSGGDDVRNFTLGQTTYDYNFLSRSSESDANGMPMLSTPSADEILQATLQHVVVNYDPIDGRSIYVNGERVAQNTDLPGNLNDWDETFAFAVGNEVDNQNLWMGTVRLLAVHERVLTEEDIIKNFEAGVGEKFFLLFSVSHLIDMPEAYIVFTVQQYDNYSYLFENPFFISLDDTATVPADLVIEGLHLASNGKEINVGQTYANMNFTITADNYDAETGTPLSTLGALVPLDKGPDDDLFFLSFDRIGLSTYDRPTVVVPPPPALQPAEEQSDIGVRTFDEINATLSAISKVPVDNAIVAATFAVVRQQMPTVETAEGFLSSHQSGVMQLSVAYCTALVSDATLRAGIFGDFDVSQSFSAAFTDEGKNAVIQPLMRALLTHDIDLDRDTPSLLSQPVPAEVEAELSSLIDKMSNSDTQTAVIATCASAFGSAVMLVQ